MAAGLRLDPLDELNRSPDPGREREGAGREEMEIYSKHQVKMDQKTFAFKALPGPAGSLSAPRPIAIGREERKIVTSECLSHLIDVHNLLN